MNGAGVLVGRRGTSAQGGRAKNLVLEVISREVKLGGVESVRLPWHLEDNGSLKEMYAD